MSDESNPKSDRGADGRFAKGNPGGPGRPPGRNAFAMRFLDDMGADAGPELFELAMKQAREGNTRMLSEMLQRVWPKHQARPVRMDLPLTANPADLMRSQFAIVEAILSGTVDKKDVMAHSETLLGVANLFADREYVEAVRELLATDKKRREQLAGQTDENEDP